VESNKRDIQYRGFFPLTYNLLDRIELQTEGREDVSQALGDAHFRAFNNGRDRIDPETLNIDDGYAGNCSRMIVAHDNREREKDDIYHSMVAEDKCSLALKRIKDGNKRGRLTSLTAGLQCAGMGCWLEPETRHHQRAYEKQNKKDEKVKQHKKDKMTHQFIDEVDALRTKYDPNKWKSIHDCKKPQIKTMVK
jgi:hypothetical protein